MLVAAMTVALDLTFWSELRVQGPVWTGLVYESLMGDRSPPLDFRAN